MKQQLTLTELAAQLDAQNKEKRDVVVSTTLLEMDDEGIIHGKGSLDLHAKPSKTANTQIAARLKIPAPYAQRMQAEAPALWAKNVNHWFNQEPEQRMLRTFHKSEGLDVLRSVNSNRFARYDNYDLTLTVLKEVGDIPGAKVESIGLSDELLHLKVLFPSIQGEVKVGDIVQSGFVFRNSELGLATASVSLFALRLACLNGMKVDDGKFSAKHVGKKISEEEIELERFAEDTVNSDAKTVQLKIRDMVRESFSQEKFDAVLHKMRSSAEDKITGNVIESVKELTNRTNLTDTEANEVFKRLIEGAADQSLGLTRWGLANAVTSLANDTDNYDRASELEAMGGKIINLPRSDWTVIAQAA